MPDRKEGFVQRGKGILAPDGKLAETYSDNMHQDAIQFDEKMQKRLIALARDSCQHQDCRVHFVATDPTHVHVLTSWSTDRSWHLTRSQIRHSITLTFNQTFERRDWLAKGGSRKRVCDQKHFDHLVAQYPPNHRGWKWSEQRGLFV